MGFGRDRDEYPASSVAEAISAVGVLDDLATSAPGVAAAATSAAAFVLTANAARRAAYATGVSCATPILGVAWGLCATAGASVVAGQAARAALEASRSGGGGWSGSVGVADVANAARVGWSSFASSSSSARSGFFRGALGGLGGRDAAWDEGEMTLDAMLGTVLYAFIGRGVHSALPSDVSHPGAMRRNSMPANGAHYASESQKRTLARWMRRDGCHHCGTRSGAVIGDHMPPNKMAFGSSAAAEASRNGTLSLGARAWNFLRMVPRQRFFPQCRACSDLQSTAVRLRAKSLVMHNGGVRIGCVVASVVAARHYVMWKHPREYERFERRVEEFVLRTR